MGKLEGLARVGGSEFFSSLDMRFGAWGKTAFGQLESALEIVSGGIQIFHYKLET